MDYPYVVLILFLLYLAFNEWRYPSRSLKYFNVACVIVFIFVAFRAPVVGADTWNYYRYAIGVRNFYNADERELEPLFLLYSDFFREHCRVGLIFMIVNTLVIFSPIYYIIKKYVNRKIFAFIAFFFFFDYSLYFIALRQVLCLSIILWGVIYVVENKKMKWTVFILLSSISWFMHTTAAIVAPLFIASYFLPIKSRLWAIVVISFTAIVGVVLQSFNILDAFNFFLSINYSATDRVSDYLERIEMTELSALNIVLRQSIVAIIVFIFICKDKLNHWFVKIYLVGICLFNLFISVPMVNRMVMANTVFVIFVVPWIFDAIKVNVRKRKLINYIMLILMLYFTRSFIITQSEYDLQSSLRMHPYYFFFEDYHDHPSIKYF